MPRARAEPPPKPAPLRAKRARSPAALARALAESEARLRSLLLNAPDVIARFDRTHQLVYANPAVEEALGIPPARLLGRSPSALGLPGTDAERWEEALRAALATGEPLAAELALVGPGGRHEYEARLVPERRRGGRVAAVLVIGRDVTERAAAERAARERDRRRADFLAVLSHELRNPLTAIQNALWLLGKAGPSGPREARARDILERQTAELSRLLDDLVPLVPGADASPARDAGPGLGLSLVRAAAALHGGTVEARGAPAGGELEVVVRLPGYGAIATSTGDGASTLTRSAGARPTRKPRDPPFT